MQPSPTHPTSPSWYGQPGTVLIVTIWVIMVLTSLVLVFARSMRVCAYTAANAVAAQQADLIGDGALQAMLALIESGKDLETTAMKALYEAVKVGDGYYWVLRSNLEDDRHYDYGLVDESSKINLNSASMEMLQKLPGMTAELAASIIDWRDSDSDVTAGGAENEYYLLLPQPYQCKNAALETVEEVLLIQGATKEMLYGEDTNRNGRLDDNENDGDESDPPDNRNGTLDRGFYDTVTVYSVEDNTDSNGVQRINVSDPASRGPLQTALREVFSQDRALEIMDLVPNNPNFASTLAFYFRSGMTSVEFAKIADRLTTSSEKQIVGLVNVNTASKPVLLCLPSLEVSDADALISKRSAQGTNLSSIAWVLDVLDRQKATAIGGFITTRSHRFSVDTVSVSENGRAFRRSWAVLDTMQKPTKVKYWQSLTHLGWPLDREILSTLRSGKPLDQVTLALH